MQLHELQAEDERVQEIRQDGVQKGQQKIDREFYWSDLPYMLEIICTKMINKNLHDS